MLRTYRFFHLGSVPLNCSALWSTQQSARDCSRGEVDLAFCPTCELIFNRQYNPELLKYGNDYENSLDFSPSFRDYAQKLAQRLASTYQLRNKQVVGIGSGRGEFLKSLCQAGENYAVGYDPSFGGDRDTEIPNIRFVQDFYSDAYASEPVDFVSCRHVLEHIEKPLEFLHGLRRMLEPHGSVTVYVEVPNGISVFGNSQMWDIIYPHVSYFTCGSLRSVFERSGFEIMEIGTAFSNQFLYAELRLSASSRIQPARIDSPVRDLIASFNTRFANTVSAWSNLFKHAIRTNKRVTFWGAGAKGVTFLNLVPYASELAPVIDSNPRKQGMFVPGTGQRILSPEDITAFQPEIVVTLNPIYQPEIEATLRELGVDAEIVSHPNVARSASY